MRQLHILRAADHFTDKPGVAFICVAIDVIVRLQAAGADGLNHGLNRQNSDHHGERGSVQDQNRDQYADFLNGL